MFNRRIKCPKEISLDGQRIKWSISTKYHIGVFLDKGLTFTAHAETVKRVSIIWCSFYPILNENSQIPKLGCSTHIM